MRQVAKKELQQRIIPDLAEIAMDYYTQRIPEMSEETPLEEAQRITQEIRNMKKQKASC